MVDQNMDEDSQSALPAEENVSKPDGSEKESTQVHLSFAYILINLIYKVYKEFIKVLFI